jgi:phage gpG-like protein
VAGAALTLDLTQLEAWAGKTAADLVGLSFRQPLQVVKVLLSASTKENFSGGHSPDGVPWLPLKRPRANSKGGDKPLRDKGLLMAGVADGGQGHVERLSDTELQWGTNLVYAAVHQFGHTFQRPERSRKKPWVFTTSDGRKVFTRKIKAHAQTVPARPYLGLNAALVEKIERVFAEHVEKHLGG